MRRLVIESPFASKSPGGVERNIEFARRVCRSAVLLGWAPYASHLFYTQPGILDDDKPDERQLGIDAGLAWGDAADEVWFCLDAMNPEHTQASTGMRYAYQRHTRDGREIACIWFDDRGNIVHYSNPKSFGLL